MIPLNYKEIFWKLWPIINSMLVFIIHRIEKYFMSLEKKEGRKNEKVTEKILL